MKGACESIYRWVSVAHIFGVHLFKQENIYVMNVESTERSALLISSLFPSLSSCFSKSEQISSVYGIQCNKRPADN